MSLTVLAFVAALALAPAPAAEALLAAARDGRAQRVSEILRKGTDPDASDAGGQTALMEASGAGHEGVVLLLLEAGAKIDARDRLGLTPLDRALRSEKPGVVRLLLDRGAVGSGKSPGDLVCVKRWLSQGYCGPIEKLQSGRYWIRVDRLDGCEKGCAADPACFPGDSPLDTGALGRRLLIPASCFTQTYPGSGRQH